VRDYLELEEGDILIWAMRPTSKDPGGLHVGRFSGASIFEDIDGSKPDFRFLKMRGEVRRLPRPEELKLEQHVLATGIYDEISFESLRLLLCRIFGLATSVNVVDGKKSMTKEDLSLIGGVLQSIKLPGGLDPLEAFDAFLGAFEAWEGFITTFDYVRVRSLLRQVRDRWTAASRRDELSRAA